MLSLEIERVNVLKLFCVTLLFIVDNINNEVKDYWKVATTIWQPHFNHSNDSLFRISDRQTTEETSHNIVATNLQSLIG